MLLFTSRNYGSPEVHKMYFWNPGLTVVPPTLFKLTIHTNWIYIYSIIYSCLVQSVNTMCTHQTSMCGHCSWRAITKHLWQSLITECTSCSLTAHDCSASVHRDQWPHMAVWWLHAMISDCTWLFDECMPWSVTAHGCSVRAHCDWWSHVAVWQVHTMNSNYTWLFGPWTVTAHGCSVSVHCVHWLHQAL